MTTSQFLARPEGRIAYDLQGAGPLVVAVPGMGDVRSSFRFLVPVLLEAGYRVATMDLRGHGDSDTTFTAYDDVAAGQDVLALVEALGGSAVLVGSSMGAGAVTWAAAQRRDAVAGLVLLGPFVRDPSVGPLLRVLMDAMLLRPWGPAVWRRYQRTLLPGHRPDDLDQVQDAMVASLTRPGAWRAFRATTRTSHAPVEAVLDDVRAPVLVVMGTRDPDFPDPAREAHEVARLLRGEVLMVDGAGHYPHVDSPDVVGPAVLAHLAAVAPRA